jgi:hypothetical protein
MSVWSIGGSIYRGSEESDPLGRKREMFVVRILLEKMHMFLFWQLSQQILFSEPIYIPICPCTLCRKYFCHIKRLPPFKLDDPRCTDELAEV